MSENGSADKRELLQDGVNEDGKDKPPSEDYGSIPKSRESPEIPEEIHPLTKNLIFLVALSAIGGFLFGYDTGVVSGAMLAIKEIFHLNYLWQELIISITIAAAAVSASAAGAINDLIGRKAAIMISSFLYASGAVITAAVNSRELLLVGRLILGFGIGLSSMTVPIYISESSPAEYRGIFTATFNMLVAIGQTIAAVVDGLFFPIRKYGWRYMIGFAAIPAVVQFIGFIFMPESPRHSVARGRLDEAKKTLSRLRPPGYRVDDEVEAIHKGHLLSQKASGSSQGKLFILIKMVRHESTRRALILGCAMQMFQQLVGINTVIYYMATIVQMAGVGNPQTAVWIAAGIATINAIGSSLGVVFVERVGRRKLTLISLTGTMFSLIILAVGFQVAAASSPKVDVHITPPAGFSASVCSLQTQCSACVNHQGCGFCSVQPPHPSSPSTINGSCLPTRAGFGIVSLYGPCHDLKVASSMGHRWYYNYCPSDNTWIIILGLVAYVVTFSCGMGPMPWTVNSEIFPTWARGTGVAIATGVNWTFNFIISISFLSLTLAITRAGTFWLYAAIAFVGVGVFCIILPETKGKTLEEMEELFSRPWTIPPSQTH